MNIGRALTKNCAKRGVIKSLKRRHQSLLINSAELNLRSTRRLHVRYPTSAACLLVSASVSCIPERSCAENNIVVMELAAPVRSSCGEAQSRNRFLDIGGKVRWDAMIRTPRVPKHSGTPQRSSPPKIWFTSLSFNNFPIAWILLAPCTDREWVVSIRVQWRPQHVFQLEI